MAKKNTENVYTIKSLNIQRSKIRIVGDTPLIVHAWSEKAKREMLETQGGKTKTKKRPSKMPFDDFARALYWITEMPEVECIDPSNGEQRMVITEDLFDEAIANGAKFGFPVSSIKIASNSAAYRSGWVKNQMELRGAYFLSTEYGEMAEIKGDVPVIREDMVRVGMGAADIRYRPMFRNWYMDLEIEYNASGNISLESILNAINAGGYMCGLGEWRPEKDGIFGRYHVETV